ncbi:MAG: Rab family GTPase [Candidatus Freyarchaeum deiterrae]
MIQGIYIIDSRGICILCRKYGSIEIDENLIGGFLTAILRFSSKLIQGADDESLREILLKNYRVLYEPRDSIMAVAVVGKEDNEELVRGFLGNILDAFIKNFGPLLEQWDGNVQPFTGFGVKVDGMLLQSRIRELITPETTEVISKTSIPLQEPSKTAASSLKQVLRRSKTFMFKIIVVGDKKVGKTSIIKKVTENKFPTEYSPTIGCDFTAKQLEIAKNKVRLHFWDFAGSANFEEMRKELYIDADLVVLVFDLTNPESFKNLEKWRWEVYNSFGNLQSIIVIGNKNDLERKIPLPECSKYAQEINAPYFETSAKLGTNVDEFFKSAGELLLKKEQETQ